MCLTTTTHLNHIAYQEPHMASSLSNVSLPELSQEFYDPYKSKLTPLQDDMLGIYLLVVGLASVVFNSFCLHVTIFNKDQMKAPELFLVNVMVADLMLTITTFPLAISSLLAHGWIGGEITCQIYAFCSYLFGYHDLLAIMCLAIVRYIFICRPTYAKTRLTFKLCYGVITGTFLICLAFATFPLSPWASYGPEISGVSCSLEWMLKENIGFVIAVMVCTFCGPMVSMFVCYSRIIYVVNKKELTMEKYIDINHPSPQNRKKRTLCAFLFMRNAPIDIQLARLTCLMWLSFLICWGPYAIISFTSAFCDDCEISPVLSIMPATFCKTSVILNPILYFTLSKRYRERCRASLTCIQTDTTSIEGVTYYKPELAPNSSM